MTTLATIFDDAFLREKERYRIADWADHGCFVRPVPDNQIEACFTGTRADCERFIHQRAREAGFAALHAELFKDKESMDRLALFLYRLAGDGDAGKGD